MGRSPTRGGDLILGGPHIHKAGSDASDRDYRQPGQPGELPPGRIFPASLSAWCSLLPLA
jgi:hypothetical protein